MSQLLENEVRRYAPELENMNQPLQNFSWMVSHDLKAPARKNSAFARILLEEYQHQLDDTAQDYLRRVDRNSRRMSQLIDDFLRLFGVNYAQLKRQTVNLSDLAHQVVETLREQDLDRHVEVRIQPELVCDGDEALLIILLKNLLENAWKFTASRDHATIEVGVEPGAPQRTVFYVRDNGVGFDMAQADRLFKPFQRLHPSGEFPGTGIGLATVRQIVEKHQGAVWATSRINQGATVYFLIP